MRKAISMVALVALVAACSSGDGGTAPLTPHGPTLGKAPAQTDPTATFWFPLADGALGLQSDHAAAYTSGDSSAYADGVCGVDSKIFATTAASNSGDAIMQTDDPRNGDRKCKSYPRKLHLILRDDGGSIVTQLSSTVFMNVHDVQNTTDIIAIGSSLARGLTLSEDPHCDGLRWTLVMPDPDDTVRRESGDRHAYERQQLGRANATVPERQGILPGRRSPVPRAGSLHHRHQPGLAVSTRGARRPMATVACLATPLLIACGGDAGPTRR